jgi:hypothetical protein
VDLGLGRGPLPDDYDRGKVEEVVMALLHLTSFADRGCTRAWKGHAFDVMHALHDRGWILDPRNSAKSVVLTDEGVAAAERLFAKHFGPAAGRPAAR